MSRSAYRPRQMATYQCNLGGLPQEMLAEYGSGEVNYWSADTFNENVPPSDDPEYLRASSAAVYGVCTSVFRLNQPCSVGPTDSWRCTHSQVVTSQCTRATWHQGLMNEPLAHLGFCSFSRNVQYA